MFISPEIELLITRLSRLPGLGPRSAQKAALALIQSPEGHLHSLLETLQKVARSLTVCSHCGNIDNQTPCSICSDNQRKRDTICVVETVSELWALEKAGVHHGLYHVLGGTLSALSGYGPEDLNGQSLINRVKMGEVNEVIVALGATVDGVTTAHWLHEQLSHYDVIVSQLGHGVPVGGMLDGLDGGTLSAALMSRRKM